MLKIIIRYRIYWLYNTRQDEASAQGRDVTAQAICALLIRKEFNNNHIVSIKPRSFKTQPVLPSHYQDSDDPGNVSVKAWLLVSRLSNRKPVFTSFYSSVLCVSDSATSQWGVKCAKTSQ